MIFHKTFFGKDPEAFKAVNVPFAGNKVFAMINFEVPVTTEYPRIISLELVGVNNPSAANFLNSHIQKYFGTPLILGTTSTEIKPMRLRIPKTETLFFGTTALGAFAFIAKGGFIGLNFVGEQKFVSRAL